MNGLQIIGWDEAFECSHSRKRDGLQWFAVPVGTESNGLIALRRHGKAGLAAFGVFQMLCQLHASTTKKDLRREGILCRNDGSPLSAEMISEKLRLDIRELGEALYILCSEDVKWVKNGYPNEILPRDAIEMPRDAIEMPRDVHHIHTDIQTKQTMCESDKGSTTAPRVAKKISYPDDFEEFWKGVPAKVSKAEAFEVWEKLSTEDREAAMGGLPTYRAYEKARKETAGASFQHLHPCRWLKKRRWEDEPPSQQSRNGYEDKPNPNATRWV